MADFDDLNNPELEPRTILLDADNPEGVSVMPDAIKIESGDNSVEIILGAPSPDIDTGDDTDHDKNLANYISQSERERIVSELLVAIENDDQSRREWLNTRAKGIDMLGFKMEEPRADAGMSTAPLEGMSTVRHPILAEAIIRFQSNASAELLPAGGPVKVRDDTPPIPPTQGGTPVTGAPAAGATPVGDRDDLATALEKDFNHYLTAVDKGYRADTDRMLFWVGFGGCSFKKVYFCPIKQMPIARSVDASDLIVSNAANDIDDAQRVTHRILMRPSILKRMQLAGMYRDEGEMGYLGQANVTQPSYEPNPVEQKKGQIQGFKAKPDRPEDQPYTIFECYTELDIEGFRHKEGGKVTGLPLPYRITIDKDNRNLLEIRRNWKEGDDLYLARKVFVKYPFVPAFGFYDIGLLHILGNASRALTGAWRIMLDSGMFSCFPGFVYAKTGSRQNTNQFRIPPGGGMGLEVSANRSIHEMIMPLPYKDPPAALIQLIELIEQTSTRTGGTADVNVAEGKQDAPVGTTLALIEQATKMISAVHVRLHAAQSEEFQLLKERFKEDPESFWRHNSRPAVPWQKEQFLKALEDYDLVPAADPNTPSQLHRIMKAVAIKQLQNANPSMYDPHAVDSLILHMIGIADPEKLFAPPQAAQPPAIPPDPNKMAELQMKQQQHGAEMQQQVQDRQLEMQQAAQEHQARMSELSMESKDRAADRQSREQVAMLHLQGERERAQHQMQLDQMKMHADIQRDNQQVAMQHQQHQMTMAQQQQQHEQSMHHESQMQEHNMASDHAMQQQKMQHQTQQNQMKADQQMQMAEQKAKAKPTEPSNET